MNQNQNIEWTKSVVTGAMVYPSEFVIRIFKGIYPRLNFDKREFRSKTICDVGCGDGRNFPILAECGFRMSGMEINKEIVDAASRNIARLGIQADIRVGVNTSIPFGDNSFDFVLSWNACYYMGDKSDDFQKHVRELARITKSDGFLILSIPMRSCFIYKDSVTLREGYQIIMKDPFHVRNGSILRMFSGEPEIRSAFSDNFYAFNFASIKDDCFGLDYHWHLAVCRKRPDAS